MFLFPLILSISSWAQIKYKDNHIFTHKRQKGKNNIWGLFYINARKKSKYKIKKSECKQ